MLVKLKDSALNSSFLFKWRVLVKSPLAVCFKVLFTNTMSHKMLRNVLNETKGQNVKVERSRSSSIAALKTILDKNVIVSA